MLYAHFSRRIAAMAWLGCSCAAVVNAQTTAFNYHGVLSSEGKPAAGYYDFLFELYSAEQGGSSTGQVLAQNAVPVVGGRFQVGLDFGASAFDGSARWIGLAVRTNGAANYTHLSPRQAVLSAPYAIRAKTAEAAQVAAGTAAGAITTLSLQDGSVTAAKIPPGQLVKSVNGLSDHVTIESGHGVTVTSGEGTVTISATGTGGAEGGWGLSGNTGTTPGPNFIGTTDDQPLMLKANNVGVGTATPRTALEVAGTVTATAFSGDGTALTGVKSQLPTPFHLECLSRTPAQSFNNQAVAVAGGYAYLADSFRGLSIYEIRDPANPRFVGGVGFDGADALALCLAGNYAYVGTAFGIRVVDISDPAHPALTGWDFLDNIACNDVAVQGNYLFVAAGDGLRIYDVADPRSPQLRQRRADSGVAARGVALAGAHVYLANDSDGLRIYTFQAPQFLSRVAYVPQDGASMGRDLAVVLCGRHAFVGSQDMNGSSVRIFDIANPELPRLVNEKRAYVIQHKLAVDGSRNLLFVPCSYNGLMVLDFSDVQNLKEYQLLLQPDTSLSMGVAVQGFFAYVARTDDLAVCFAANLATVSGAVKATGFFGDGAGLTGLNAGQLQGQLPAPFLSGVWHLGGNTGTAPDRDFLGTTDLRRLELRVNNEPVFRLDTNGSLAMGTGVVTGQQAVALGYETAAGNLYSTALGHRTAASGQAATAMGEGSQASGASAIAMGRGVQATGDYAVAAGYGTLASGPAATALGNGTSAKGLASLSAGNRAVAAHPGTFVWADSQEVDFVSQTEDQFLIRAARGVGINKDAPLAALDVAGTVRATSFRSESDVSFSGALTSGPIEAHGDLEVSGSIRAAGVVTGLNTPGVKWSQQPQDDPETVVEDDREIVLAHCTCSSFTPGYFFITCTANMLIEVGLGVPTITLSLWDITAPLNPAFLTKVAARGDAPDPFGHDYPANAALTWVVPVNTDQPTQSFSLTGRTNSGRCRVGGRNLTVMFFPRKL